MTKGIRRRANQAAPVSAGAASFCTASASRQTFAPAQEAGFAPEPHGRANPAVTRGMVSAVVSGPSPAGRGGRPAAGRPPPARWPNLVYIMSQLASLPNRAQRRKRGEQKRVIPKTGALMRMTGKKTKPRVIPIRRSNSERHRNRKISGNWDNSKTSRRFGAADMMRGPIRNMNSTPDTFIPLQEAARRLSVTTRTLYREIAAKRFPAPVKVGHSSRVREADYAAYVTGLMSKRTA